MSSLSHKLSTRRILLKSFVSYFSVSALTLLTGWREGQPMRIKITRLLMFVSTHGEGTHLFSWVSHTPVPWEQSPSAPQFLGFSCIYAYTLWHGEIQCSKTYGEKRFQPYGVVCCTNASRAMSATAECLVTVSSVSVERFQQIVSCSSLQSEMIRSHIWKW